jgi:hypothetical protein
MQVSSAQSKEVCDAFGFYREADGKLLIYNCNSFSGTSEGAWQ